jgi:outer membrane protein assembly factor BamB
LTRIFGAGTVSGILFVLLLVSVFTGVSNLQSAKANAGSRGETVQATDPDWWPMFHHDLNHTGTSTSTAPTTNNTLWKYTTGAPVYYSSPAVVGGLVYVGSADKNVYCLNATTGALVWNYTTGAPVVSSPAVVGGYVYVGSDDDNVYCLNAATGAWVWNYTTSNWPVESSPAVVGGLVYVGSWDHKVYCLNATTGAFIWSYKTGNAVRSSPAVVGGLVYVGSYNGVCCLNATTGTLVWFNATSWFVDSSPAVVGGLVYVGDYDGYVYCLNAATGALVWSYRTTGHVESSPAVVGGLVYVGSDDYKIYCLNAATGTKVWNYTTGDIVGTSSPAVVGGLVYVGSWDCKIYCLNAATGAFVWSYKTGLYVESSPAVVNGVVYVGSNDGKVYAFGPLSTQLEFSLLPNQAYVGQTVTMLGNLTDSLGQPVNNTKINLYVNGAYAASLFTNSSGWFKASAPVTSPGTFTVNVTYAGSNDYNPSSHVETLTVYQTMDTKVTFTLTPNPAKAGQTVTLKGNLTTVFNTPIGNAPLELWVKIGAGPWQYMAALSTNSTGWFQASGKVTSTGTYQVAVVYRGTSQYKMSYRIETLTVNP